MARLGFSDLTEDQALVVSVYRDWHASADGCQAFEETVIAALGQDPLFQFLDTIFATFRQIASGSVVPCGISDLLSPQEEQLLDALALNLSAALAQESIVADFNLGDGFPSVADISRSGRDELRQKIDASCQCVASTM